MIKVIKEEHNYWKEYKMLIVYYKLIIGERIIWIMIMKIYMKIIFRYWNKIIYNEYIYFIIIYIII